MLFDPRWKLTEADNADVTALFERLQRGVSYNAMPSSQVGHQQSQEWRGRYSCAVNAFFKSFFSGVRKLRRQIRVMTSRKRRRAVAVIQARKERRKKSLQSYLRKERARNSTAMMALEPRIVFDAAMGATADAAVDQVAEQQASEVAFGGENSSASFDGSANSGMLTHGTSGGIDIIIEGLAEPDSGHTELIFIDSGVEDVQGLIAGLNPAAEIIFLNANSDGLEQIAEVVSDRKDIDAIHILSHGEPGEITLGNAVLDAGSIDGAHADELATIQTALSDDADILIYGCNFGSNYDVLTQLAAATGADVAASTDDTGAAARGGDWDLESSTGTIEAESIAAEHWNGLLAQLNISVSGPPSLTFAGDVDLGPALNQAFTGDPFTPVSSFSQAIWENAGTVGGVSIDLVADVTNVGEPNGTAIQFFTSDDDPSLAILNSTANADVTVTWSIYQSGTNQSVVATGSPKFTVSDIDGLGVVNTLETITPSLSGLQSYTTDANSALVTTVSPSGLEATGTTSDGDDVPTGTIALGPGRDEAAITFDWVNVSSWSVTYTSESGSQGRVFSHDADGDFTFTTPITENLLGIDLDESASGTGFATTFNEGGAAVGIVDTDVLIEQNIALGTELHQADIVLSNAQAGDRFLVNASTATSGTVNGLNYTMTTANGQISIALTGTATRADYHTALQAITFENPTTGLSSDARLISVSATNTTFGTTTNVALTTIDVNTAPTIDLDYIGDLEIVPGQGTFAALSFSDPTENGFDGQTEEANNGDGEFARYANVGSINGQSIDFIATVVRVVDDPSELSGVQPQDGENIGFNATGPAGNRDNANARFGGSNAGADKRLAVEVRWQAVISGTTTPITGDFAVVLSDLDQTGGADGNRFEEIAVDTSSLDGFTIGETGGGASSATGSDIQVQDRQGNVIFEADNDPTAFSPTGLIRFNPTDSDPGTPGDRPDNSVQLNFTNTSEFTVIYNRQDAGGNIGMDGNFTTPFFGSSTSVDTNPDFANIYTENGNQVTIASDRIRVFDDGQIASVTISLTNAQVDDVLHVPANLPNGITVDGTSTTTNIILNGLASPEDYEAAINAFTFENVSENAVANVTRLIEIQATDDGGLTTNIATASIDVVPLNDSPVSTVALVNDGTVIVAGAGTPASIVTLNAGNVADVAGLTGDDVRDALSNGQTAGDLGLFSVADLLAQLDTNDVEQIDFGIGVTFANEAQGVFQYVRTSAGFENHEFTDVQLGDPNNADPQPVPDGDAILFASDTVFRFIPDAGYAGGATLQFRVWDQTEGQASSAPSTIADDSDLATSSLSLATFVVGVGFDTDGDGVDNEVDIDDDNDGILDNVEGLNPGGTGAFAFFSYSPAVGALANGPYDVSWVVDGTTFTDTVQNSAEFAAFLTSNDPTGAVWTDSPGVTAVRSSSIVTTDFAATSTDLLATYQSLTITHVATSITSDLGTNVSGEIVAPSERDTDGDGISDHLDIDSDNDGITDNIEAQTTDGYIALMGDQDGDGLDDAYDATPDGTVDGAGSLGLTPVNTDASGTAGVTYIDDTVADYLDTDSDGDGISDNNENGLDQAAIANGTLSTAANDADGDGLFDQYETAIDGNINDGFVVSEGVTDPLTSAVDHNGYLPDGGDADAGSIVPLLADLDYRDVVFDNDPPVAVNDSNVAVTPAVTETVTAADLTSGLSGNVVTIVDASNTLTVSVASGPDGFMNDAPFGVGFARNSGADDNTLEVSLLNGVDSIDLELGFLNNDDQPAGSDGIEQLANFLVFDVNGVDITSQITFVLVDNSTQGGLSFEAISSLNGQPNSLVPDGPSAGSIGSFGENTNGILSIATNGPAIGSVQFTHQNFPDTRDGVDQPFGVVLQGVTYSRNATGVSTAFETDENTPLSISVVGGVISNDSDPDGDVLNVTRVVSGSTESALASLVDGTGVGSSVVGSDGGLVTINANGSVDFDPNGEFDYLADGESATTSVAYQIDDGKGGVDQAVVTITVNGVNDPVLPVDPTNPDNPPSDPNNYIPAQSGSDSTAVTDLDLTPYFADADSNDTITVSIVPADLPPGLTFNPLTNTIGGTPDANASQLGSNGDGVYPITVTATDGNGSTITTVVTYTITNPAPVAENDALTGDEDTVVTDLDLFATNPTAADVDPDGDTFTVTRVLAGNDGAALSGLTDGTGVSSAVTGSNGGIFTVLPNGKMNFDPGNDFSGLAVGESATTEIVYQIDDGEGGTDQAVVTYTVTGVNDPVVPADPGDPTGPADPNDYIPAQSGSDSAAVTDLDLTPYFSDGDTSDTVTLSIAQADLPPGLTFNAVTNTISGTPDANASQLGPNDDGVYPITVTATDGNGSTITTVVSYTITNPPPVAENDTLTGDEDTVVAVNLFDDNGTGDVDRDPDGDNLNITRVVAGNDVAALSGLVDGTGVSNGVTGSMGGTFTVLPSGALSFDPGSDFNDLAAGEMRTTEVVYQIDDGQGGMDTAVAIYTVTGVNDPVVPVDPGDPKGPADPNDYIPAQTGKDASQQTPLILTPFFADPDGSDTITLSVDPAQLPSGLTFDPLTNTISGTPDANASQNGPNNDGVYPITVTATDGNGSTITTTVTYTITNPAPIAENDALTGDEDTLLTGLDLFADNSSGNVDYDPDDDMFSVTRVAGGSTESDLVALGNGTGVGAPVKGSHGGMFTVKANGSFDFDPGIDFQDLDVGESRATQIVYQIDDGEGGTDTAVVTFTVAGLNDAPEIIDPANPGDPKDPNTPADPNNIIPDQTGEDSSPLTPLDISPFFTDVDNETLTFGFNPADTNVPDWLSIDPVTGIITGTPPSDASQFGPHTNGVYPITIIATDPDGALATTTIDFTITNPAPDAQDDDLAVSENAALTVPVGAGVIASNDTDPDGDTLFVSAVGGVPSNVGEPITGTNGGVFTVNPVGAISFDTAGDFEDLGVGETATTTIEYTLSDGDGGTDTATITVTVEGANDAPVVNGPVGSQNGTDGVAIIPIDTTVAFSNPNGAPLTFAVDNIPPGLMLDPVTGEISGTPAPGASQGGPYTVTVTATTPAGDTATTTFVYTIENPDPTASDDQTSTNVDTSVAINPLGNDTDPDDDTLKIVSTGPSANGGTVSINANGTVNYTPSSGFTGIDTFTYTIGDGNGGTDTAIVTVEVGVTSVEVPATTGVTAQQNEDGELITPVDVFSAFTDPNGDPLTFVGTGLPAGLIVDPVTGIISGTIDPSASQAGPYPVVITATDPDGNQISTTFDWIVGNPVPVAVGDTMSTPLETPVTFSPLGNDTDPDGDNLTVEAVGMPDNGGTVTVNPDGTVTYTPATGFSGTETFSYTVTDADGATDTAMVTVVVDGTVPGAPEVAKLPVSPTNNDGAAIAPVDVSTSFSDPTGDPLTFTAVGLPEGLSIDPTTGVISGTIDPGASEHGPYDVIITVTDPDGNVTSAPLSWTVNNPVPDPTNDSASTLPGVPVTINVLGNDVDPDGDSLTVTQAGPSANGSMVSINPDGTVIYTPVAGFVGTDTFTYTVDDGNGGTNTATVQVMVDPAPMGLVSDPSIPAQTQNDSDTPNAIDVSALVSDPEGKSLTFTVDNLPPGLTLDPVTGIISGKLDHSASQGGPNSDGVYPLTITTTDPDGGMTTISFTYTAVNPAPDAQDDDLITDEDSTLSGSVFLDNDNGADVDPDGDRIVVTEVNGTPINSGVPTSLPSGAILTMNADGTYDYNPNGAFESLGNGQIGTDTFTYQVSDGEGGFDTATVNLTVGGINDAPVAFDDEVTTPEDVPVTFDPRDNDTDVEGDLLTITAIDGISVVAGGPSVTVEGGEIALNLDGTLTFTPDPDYNGKPSFIYTVRDPDGLTATATVALDVIPVADRNFDPGMGDMTTPVDGTPADGNDDLSAEPIVLDTVKGIGGWGHSLSIDRSIGSRVTHMDWLGKRFSDLQNRYGDSTDPFAAGGLIGFSLKSDVSGVSGSEGSVAAPKIVIDTLMRQGQLFVEITNTIDMGMDKSATRYDVTRPDGKPLPDWVQKADNGLLMANVPADQPPLDLKIVVTLENGSFVEQLVHIKTASGELQPVEFEGHIQSTGGFSDQLNRALGSDVERIQEIERFLKLQQNPLQ